MILEAHTNFYSSCMALILGGSAFCVLAIITAFVIVQVIPSTCECHPPVF